MIVCGARTLAGMLLWWPSCFSECSLLFRYQSTVKEENILTAPIEFILERILARPTFIVMIIVMFIVMFIFLDS